MKELWLNFRDPNGGDRRVEVVNARFVIGRHSECDLCVPDTHLSREHVRIERKGDEFIVSDLGSSNGTTLNGESLVEPTHLKNGDEILLGGAIVVRAEIPSDAEADAAAPEVQTEPETPEVPTGAAVAGSPSKPVYSSAAQPAGSGSKSIFIIAPILGLIVLAMIGGLIYFLGGRKQPVIASDNEFQYSRSNDDDDPPLKSKDAKKVDKVDDSTTPTSSPIAGNNSSTGDTSGNSSSQPPPANLSDTAKIEQNGASFLRRIAQNDTKAFLTTDQAKRLTARIKQFSNSGTLADNINSARKSSSQLRTLAAAKNLKPQLLAVAAMAKLGNSRGDVLQAANSVADVLDKLGTQVGNESSDDALLMIAAFDQGSAGDFMKMRNMLQDLANKFPESARSIRSIWFLEKNGKITPAEFDSALTFLAIGTITQNPKDFGVNAEALSL